LADHWRRKRSPALPLLRPEPTSRATPYQVVTEERPARKATKQLLMSLSRHLEYRAADPSEPGVLVACFQEAQHFDCPTQRRYAHVAESAVMVAALGRDMPTDPAPRVRGTRLDPDDPLADEWVVIVVAAHFGAALVARHLPPGVVEAEVASYEFAITYDRDLVIAAAQSLMQRIESRHMPHP